MNTNDYPPVSAAPVTIAGRELTLPRLNQDDKKAFGTWSAAKAITDAKALEACTAPPGADPTPDRPLSRQEFFETLESTKLRATAGDYGFHSDGGIIRRQTEEGFRYLVWVCLKRVNKPVDKNDPGVSFADVLATPIQQLNEAYGQANADPDPKAPAGTSGPDQQSGGTGDGSGGT
jgi:hypothetical protein